VHAPEQQGDAAGEIEQGEVGRFENPPDQARNALSQNRNNTPLRLGGKCEFN
jgi:hypothetical protein